MSDLQSPSQMNARVLGQRCGASVREVHDVGSRFGDCRSGLGFGVLQPKFSSMLQICRHAVRGM